MNSFCCGAALVSLFIYPVAAPPAGQPTRTTATMTAPVSAAPTCAILADATAGLDYSPVVALLEAKLSQDSRVWLLERAEITRILSEHSLSLSLAESTPKSRREWGQVLRAQMLVLLQTRQVKEGKVIEAGFVETRHGLSLGSERLVWDDRAEQIASLLARRISQVAGTATADLKYVFAVPPFEAEDLSPDSLQYQSAYAQLVEETLSHLPGVVMADLAHAAEVARELAVSEGETSVARALPYYLHGRHKMTGPTGNRTVSFHLELRHGQETIASMDKDAIHPDSAASFLRESCTELARKVIGGARQAPVNGATTLEADLLEERCRAYRLVGEWESSIRMAEAALLLDPGRHELRAQLLYLYERLVWVWNGRRFEWETEFRRKQDANMRKRTTTRPYDLDAEPIPVRAFVQCGFAAINHAWHLAHERPLRREEVWPLCNLVSTASRPFNSPHIYDWKQDASSLAPLMRGLLDQYSGVCSYVLSNSRISDDQNRSAYTYMASSVCKLASSSPWIGREEQLDVLRRCLLAIEPADGSFAVQWDVVSSVSDMLWSAPEPARERLFVELSRGDTGSTRFIVDCLRVTRSFRVIDQALRVRKELDAIASKAFPDESAPPIQMRGVYTTFEYLRSKLESGGQVPTRQEAADDTATADNTVQFSIISRKDPRLETGHSIKGIKQWLSLGNACDVLVASEVEVMTRPWEQTGLGTFEGSWPQRGHVQWDGRYLWVSEGRGRLHVFEGSSWKSVAVFEGTDGLPAMGHGCKIAPLGPGRVCVAGATGQPAFYQSWIATVELSGDRTTGLQKSVDVFYSARQISPAQTSASTQPNSLARGFLPVFALTVPSATGLPLVIVGRHNLGEGPPGGLPALLVNPGTRQVTILPEKWGSDWAYIAGPDRVYVLTYREVHMPLVPIVASAQLPDTELREVIALDQPRWEFVHATTGVLEGHLLHAIGQNWYTVDLSGPRILRKAPVDVQIRKCQLSRSDFYGLVAYSYDGAWQVRFGKTATGPALPVSNDSAPQVPSEGALVAWLPNRGRGWFGSQATELKIAIGDIIVAVNGQKISGAADFMKASADLENNARTIEMINETDRRTVTVQPGKIGMFVCDYRASYGPVVKAALLACRDRRYARAYRAFEEASARGLDVRSNALLSLIYAHCVYYSGDAPKALIVLDECIAQGGKEPGFMLWELYRDGIDLDVASPSQNVDGHLGLYLRQRVCHEYPDHVNSIWELAHYQQRTLRQYPVTVPVWMELMNKASASNNKILACAALEHLRLLFSDLKMKPEDSAVCRYLVDSGLYASGLTRFDETLLEAGEPELAVRVWEAAEPAKRGSLGSGSHIQRIIGAAALAGQIQEAQSIISRLEPPFDAIPSPTFIASNAFLIGWQDLAADYAAYARRILTQYRQKLPIRLGAFSIMSHLPNPDLTELTGIYDSVVPLDWEDTSASPTPDQFSASLYLPGMKLTLLMLQGDYEAVLRQSKGAAPERTSHRACQRDAALFLREHAAGLARTKSPFLATQYALQVPSRGWLLLTRDHRMGWASPDGNDVTEIPLPDRAWTRIEATGNDGQWDYSTTSTIRRSDSGDTIVVLGGPRTVYALNPDCQGWTRLIWYRFEKSSVGGADVHEEWLDWLQPVLDKFASFMLAKEEPAREVVWPPGDQDYLRGAKAMLSDGTWIVTDKRSDRKFLDLSSVCAKALRGPIEIYETSDLTADGPAYLYTSQGVLKWRRADNQIVPIPFPDRTEPAPVFPLTEGGERLKDKVVRLAVLPEAGGAIYQLDLVEGKLTRDAGINRCYPMTYWLQKPVEWNRQQVIDAVTKAGLPWPPPWLPIQTTDSQPARR